MYVLLPVEHLRLVIDTISVRFCRHLPETHTGQMRKARSSCAISLTINTGKVAKVGYFTLQQGGEYGAIYRGSGVTLVVKQDGSYWTLLTNDNTGMDKVISQYLVPELPS